VGAGLPGQDLTDSEKATYLREEAARRGLRITDEVVAYLLAHVRRDLPTLVAILAHLDDYSLSRQRPLTLPFGTRSAGGPGMTMGKGATNLALLDLDNTLLAGDSDYEWGQFLIDRGILDRAEYEAQNDTFFAQYKAGSLDIHEYLQLPSGPWRATPPRSSRAGMQISWPPASAL